MTDIKDLKIALDWDEYMNIDDRYAMFEKAAQTLVEIMEMEKVPESPMWRSYNTLIDKIHEAFERNLK